MGSKRDPEASADPLDSRSPRGRVRAAWSVLRGQRLVPLQVQLEWLEYQQIFDDLLKRFSAQLARQEKNEKSRLQVLLGSPENSPPVRHDPANHKAELRSRAALLRGVRIPASSTPQEWGDVPQPPHSTPASSTTLESAIAQPSNGQHHQEVDP